MNEYNYKLFHVEGSKNQAADGLSRVYGAWEINSAKFNLYNLTEIYESQKVDKKCQALLNQGVLSQVLLNQSPILVDEDRKIYVPHDVSEVLLIRVHEFLGHPGREKMYNSLKKFIRSLGLVNQIAKVTKTCRDCQVQKNSSVTHINFSKFFRSNEFNQVVCTDITGPFETTDYESEFTNSKFYVLTIIDVYSRFTLIFMIEQITADAVVRCFQKWINRFGTPQKIMSDNGRQYISSKTQMFLKEQGIVHVTSPRNTPQSNGLAERINSSINNILRIYKERDLNLVKDRIFNLLNHTFHRSVGCSPSELVYKFNSLDPHSRDCKDEVLIKKRELEARKALRIEGHKIVPFQGKVGQLVLVRTHNLDKMGPKFIGPAEIVKLDLQNNRVQVQFGNKLVWESVRNVKEYFGKEEDVAVSHISIG